MHITHEKPLQSQGGAELESSTATPNLATPLSSALAMITPAKTCQPKCGAGSKGTPTPPAPQSSVSKRNISPSSTCQSEGGGPELEHSMTTPTLADPLSSVLAMIISAKGCFGQGGAQPERDRNGPPTPAAPPPFDSERYISPARIRQSEGGSVLERDSTAVPTPAAPLLPREAPAVNGDDTLSCSSSPNSSTGDFMRPWCGLSCSSALSFYADDTGLFTPLSGSVPPAHLQPSSYLLSPEELPRCRQRLRRPGQARVTIPSKIGERARCASRTVTAGYILPNRQTTTGDVSMSTYSGLGFFL